MGFKAIITAILLMGIFFIAMVNFNVALIELNGGNLSLKDNAEFNSTFNSIIFGLENVTAVYNNQSDIVAGTAETTQFTSIPTAVAGMWTVIKQAPEIVYNIIFNLIFAQLFGGDPDFAIVFLTFAAIIVLALTLFALKNMRTAEA